MSASIDTEPNAKNAVKNCIEYELSMTDGGTPPEEKSLTYQLVTQAGDEVTGQEIIPYRAGSFFIQFQKDLEPWVFTTKPTLGSTTVFTDNNFNIQFKLKFGEWIFNTDTCQVTNNLTQEGSLLRAYNCAFQFRQTTPFAGKMEMGTARPLMNYTCRSQDDWIMVMTGTLGGGDTWSILVNATDSGGPNSHLQTHSAGAAPVVFPVGAGNPFFGGSIDINDISAYDIYVFDGIVPDTNPPTPTLGVEEVAHYRFIINQCCTVGDFAELIWLEPRGGYASILLDVVDSIGVSRAGGTICLPKDCSPTIGTMPGLSGRVSRATSAMRLTLKKYIRWGADAKYFLSGLFASNTHMIKTVDEEGNTVALRFIIESGDYNWFNEFEEVELTISGRIEPEILAQQYQ